MQLLKKKEEEIVDDSEMFAHTKKFISDELEVIQDQEENLVQVSEEIEKALSHSENMKKLVRIIQKADKTIRDKLGEKRKQESSMINTLEEIKGLIRNQRYEDIDRLMQSVKGRTQTKLNLTKQEMEQLRDLMAQIDDLYKEAAGLCRLYQLVYANMRKMYDECQYEFRTENIENEELSRAGTYTERIH